MIDLLSTTSSLKIISGKLPTYARKIPEKFLIKIFCRGKCCSTRWARLNKPYPGKSALKKAQTGEYMAVCLKCGYKTMDNYNWYR